MSDENTTPDPADTAEAADDTPVEEPLPEVPPPPALPEEGEPLEHIVDDVEERDEARAWAYMEMKRGRPGEEVHADLVAKGWDSDDAEGLVEAARESHGALDAVANAPFKPLKFRGFSGLGGRLVNFIVGIFVAIFTGNSAIQEELDRRHTSGPTGQCAKCGLDLQGSSAPCPNCGTVQPPHNLG